MTFTEIKKTFHDLIYAERGSGIHEYAKTQFLRMLSPFASFLLVMLMVIALLAFCVVDNSEKARDVSIDLEVVEIEEIEDVADVETIEYQDVKFTDNVDFAIDAPAPVVDPQPGPVSPKPAQFNAVAITKSTVVMKSILGARNPEQIGNARTAFGGSDAGEASVLNALRWLKTKQLKDGSWPNCKPAMTGLALLCYLAHGELPDSAEFGATVKNGIEYLIKSYSDQTGTFAGHDGNNYAHLIATYALCEAYSMTRNPIVKEVAEKALVKIVKGQHPNGGWDYKMAQTTRDDTSYMGWAAQAVKAGYMAGNLDVEDLGRAYTNAAKGFLVNYHRDGGFGYTSPSHTSGLTAVGTLCMQLLHQKSSNAVKNSLRVMDDWTLGWIPDKNDINTQAIPSHVGVGQSQQYYAYYATQAMFQDRGARWNKWNSVMKVLYPRMQKVQTKETSGYVDDKGLPQSIGHWENGDANKDNGGPFIMDTCLACLQMEVYYRYLPTYEIVKIEDVDVVLSGGEDDVGVTIEF